MISKKPSLLILFLFLNCTIFFSQQNPVNETKKKDEKECGGVERWSVKVLTDPHVNLINFTPSVTTISALAGIVTPLPYSGMPRHSGVEDKTYSVVCNITIKKNEPDNDYHLVLSDGINRLIGEVPDPYCSAAASSSFVNNYIAVRNFVNSTIASGNVYNVTLPKVVVYGVAFVDLPHGQTGAAPNNLELHPILGIHFLSETEIEEHLTVLKVMLFPNPAAETLNLQISSRIDDLSGCDFRIFNAQGSHIKTMSLPGSGKSLSARISVGDLNPGLFFYRITKNGATLYEGKFTRL